MSMIIDGTNGLTFNNSTVQASAGSVIQVVQGTLTSNFSSSANTFTATGLSVSITPKFSTSKILLLAAVGIGVSSSNYVDLTIFNNSTNLAGAYGFLTTYSSSATLNVCQNFNYLDSPASTSAISYSVRMRSESSISYSIVNGGGQVCTLIAMEIAG